MRKTLGSMLLVSISFFRCVGDTSSPSDAGGDATADTLAQDVVNPVDVDAGPTPAVTAIFAGGAYNGGSQPTLGNGDRSCAVISPTGTVKCWGDNALGEMGLGTAGTDSLTPTAITKDIDSSPFADVDDLALGGWHTCARKKNGKVFCWGQDQSGAIGDNSVDPNGTRGPVTSPQPLALGSFVAMQGSPALAAGYGSTCAIDSTGKVNCWGWNGPAQLGHDPSTDPSCSWLYAAGTKCNGGPVAVIDNSPFTNGNVQQVTSGENMSCVRTAGANVFCFGERSWFGTPAGGNPAPVEVMTNAGLTQPLTNVAKIASGPKTICALTTAQSVYCAGFDAFGQTGNTGGTSYNYATQISNLTGVKDISGGETHFCAVKLDGSVWCWGNNNEGQLGTGSTDGGISSNPVPTQVVGLNGQGTLANAVSVACGYAHSCALLKDGSVWCWGQNNHGQLGDGTTTDRASPAPVQGLP